MDDIIYVEAKVNSDSEEIMFATYVPFNGVVGCGFSKDEAVANLKRNFCCLMAFLRDTDYRVVIERFGK